MEGLARDTACRAAGQIGESGPRRSTDVRKGSFTETPMLTAESLALAHLLPMDRSEATPQGPATAEADQPSSASAVSITPQRD